jgi:hypothetical protein
MPRVEPLLFVFALGVLLYLSARPFLRRALIPAGVVAVVGLLIAQLTASPHFNFYVSLLVAMGIEMQFGGSALPGRVRSWVVPGVLILWAVVWLFFPAVYVDSSKWLQLALLLLYVALALVAREKASRDSIPG